MSDDERWDWLIEGILQKDEARMGLFVEKTQGKLFEFCFYISGHRQFAEDLCHDTFIKAFTSIGKLKDSAKVLAWLKQVARRIYLDHLRSAHASRPHRSLEESEWDELTASGGFSEDFVDAVKMLHKLEADDREVLILVDIQGYSYEETAEILEIPQGTVKSRVHRCRQKFSSLFQGTK